MSPRRRDLARLAAGLCLAGLALGRPPAALAQGGGDSALIEAAIELEQRLALLYERERFAEAELFATHSHEHVRGLGLALRNRGGRPPAAPRAAGARPGPAGALALETAAVGACHGAIGELRDERLLATFAAIMANHGQHLVVLRETLGRDPIPTAFEPGRVQ
jgi:hypothetical protein